MSWGRHPNDEKRKPSVGGCSLGHQTALELRSHKRKGMVAPSSSVQQVASARERMDLSMECSGPRHGVNHEGFPKVYPANAPTLGKQVPKCSMSSPPTAHPCQGLQEDGQAPVGHSGQPRKGVSLCCACHTSQTRATCHAKPRGSRRWGPRGARPWRTCPRWGRTCAGESCHAAVRWALPPVPLGGRHSCRSAQTRTAGLCSFYCRRG